jgi:hypothetical protein
MDPAKADLMRALGRLVRGLSILFWGIPLTIAAGFATARADWLDRLGALGFAPALVFTGLLLYGLRQLRHFQPQERVWLQALHRAETFAIVNIGMAPFLFWWRHFPSVPFFFACVNFLAVTGLLFLIEINRVLRRLAAMLPDEMLRIETRTFTLLNTWLLSGALACLAGGLALKHFQGPVRLMGPRFFDVQLTVQWLMLFLTLMPAAVTEALLWKIKEAIFSGLFELER